MKNSEEDVTVKSEKTGQIKIKTSKPRRRSKRRIKINKKSFFFYFCRLFPACLLAAMFFIPMGMDSVNLMDISAVPEFFMPYKLPFIAAPAVSETFLHIAYFAIYFVPFTALFLIISLAIKDHINTVLYVLVSIAFTIYVLCAATLLINFANSPRWFLTLPIYVYIVFSVSVLFHIFLSIYGLILLRRVNPEYAEYKKMQAETKDKIRISIKSKLTLTIIVTTSVILLIFTFLILRSYNSMFTEAVSDIGRSQAEQTASVYDTADGKYEKIAAFFDQQNAANAYADSPFERIDIITPVKKITAKDGLFLENIDEDSLLPDFDELSYTTAVGKVSSIPESDKRISAEDAHYYLHRYKSGEYKKSPVYVKETGKCKYIYPVTFTRKDGHLLVGFSIVTYSEEVLMKSYFHTKVFVFTMVFLFLYIALIVALLISDFITNPLLFLRTNVHKTSESLGQMLAGNAKISADKLVYTDSISTRDETKELSKEIKNMVGIIRGIVPYISFSTLQNAERDNAAKRSYSRELCFLFTDIRGFTTLCEGRQPKEVVDILNHYLDLETQIILNNGGDVDKFVGDEMMAFFAGPKKEYNACKAAMEIRAAMYEQHQLALENGDDYINMGIGINTGKVIFGSVGSQNRKDFTSIGDTVNLAARLEGANKAYGSKSIITEAVFEKLKDTFVCRELDFITVKGKTEPVRIYEILQTKALASDKIFEIKDLFEKGLKEYRLQHFDKAEEYFRLCNEKYTDMPSMVFLNRIEHFKTNPPPKKWDGVFVMTVK